MFKLNRPKLVWLTAICATMTVVSAGRVLSNAEEKGADPAVELYQMMGEYWNQGEHEQVVRLGQNIYGIDRYGEKYDQTSAVYAIMAGSYAILGQRAEQSGDVRLALWCFKRAASCNRSFADALQIYRKLPGTSKEHADEAQNIYRDQPQYVPK